MMLGYHVVFSTEKDRALADDVMLESGIA